MHVINPTGETKTLNIIPREYITDVTVNIKNLQTNVESSDNISTTFEYGFQNIELSGVTGVTWTEGTYYDFDVISDDPSYFQMLMYRGQIYATEQTDLMNYNISKGDYTFPDDKDDEIIII